MASKGGVTVAAERFENAVGYYEALRLEGEQVRYKFTNRDGSATEANMPVLTWQRMKARAKQDRNHGGTRG